MIVVMFNDKCDEQTVMTEEKKKRLCDVLCIAPWTGLDLKSEFEKREQNKRKEKGDKCNYG